MSAHLSRIRGRTSDRQGSDLGKGGPLPCLSAKRAASPTTRSAGRLRWRARKAIVTERVGPVQLR